MRSYKDMGYILSSLPIETTGGCRLRLNNPDGFWCSKHALLNGEVVHIATISSGVIMNAALEVVEEGGTT